MMSQPGARHCADHRTPLLFEHWYVAALSREIDQSLSERWLLQQSILLYRKRDGNVVALQNRCPHRSYPLSHGERDGDAIICGYHGLTFASDGRCIRIPSQEGAATRLRTRTYPILERPPFVWIWMGNTSPREEPPTAPWLNTPRYEDVTGVLDIKCSYIRLHENVLDLTHLPFLHRINAGATALYRSAPQMSEDGFKVRVRLETELTGAQTADTPTPQPGGVRVVSELCFESPAVHYASSTTVELGAPENDQRVLRRGFVHAFTPVDPVSTRYFWCVSRDYDLGNSETSGKMLEYFTRIFMQDVVGLSLVEDMWAREKREGFREISVDADRPGLRMRRNIEKLASDEASHRARSLEAELTESGSMTDGAA